MGAAENLVFNSASNAELISSGNTTYHVIFKTNYKLWLCVEIGSFGQQAQNFGTFFLQKSG